jgi:hypothetical protein
METKLKRWTQRRDVAISTGIDPIRAMPAWLLKFGGVLARSNDRVAYEETPPRGRLKGEWAE